MPTYNFRQRETGEIIEKFFSISSRTEFLATHPEYEQMILEAPSLGDPAAFGKMKPPSDFLKHVRDPIVTRNRGLQSERYRSPAEV